MVAKHQRFIPSTLLPLITLLLVLLAKSTCAQTTETPKDRNFSPGTDFSLGTLGQMTFSRNPVHVDVEPGGDLDIQKTQSESPSAGALVTFHGAMAPYVGYNVNFSYSRFTQTDSVGSGFIPTPGTAPPPVSGSYMEGALDTNMYELTIAYAFDGPRNKRFRTFGQIGGGGLFFEPINAPFAKQQTRPAMVFGVGMEYIVSSHFSVRAEYRGLFYKGPDFAIDNGTFPQQRLFTVTNTPAISLVYHFKGQRDKRYLVARR